MKGIFLVFTFIAVFMVRCSSLATEPDLFVLGVVAEIQHGRSCVGAAANDSELSLLTVDLPEEFLSELESQLRPYLSDGKQLWVEGRYAQVLGVQEKRRYWFALALSDRDGSGNESVKVESTCVRLREEEESVIKHPEEISRSKLRRQTRTVEKEGVCCKHGLKHHKKKQNSFKWCKDSMNAPPSDVLRNDSNKCRSGSVLCCDCCHIGFKASRLGRPYCDLAAHSSSGTCRDVLLDCCFEQTVRCPTLAHPNHGSIALSEDFSYKSSAEYSCNLGYQLNGPNKRICQNNDQWSESEPTCEKISCGGLVAPHSGHLSTTGTSFEDTASYSCDTGYTLNGPAERTCQADGQWNGSVPTCERDTCGQPAVPSNGRVDTSAGTSFGDVVMYTCDTGYTLSGVAERRCQADKRWSGNTPICARVSCGQPGVPSNGRVNTTDGVLFGDVVRYSCDAGYMVSGLAERTCQAEKRWSGSVPTCERISCGEPDVPSNGRVDISDGTLFEDVCRYSCDAGYMLVGPANRTCQADGQWSGSERICERVSCGQLDTPSNGHVNTSAGTSFMDVARYSCVEGYVLSGRAERTCQADQQWSGRVPACERHSCGRPRASTNGRVDTSAGTSFGDVVRYLCDIGYMLSGVAERTCQADKRWSGSVPTCAIVDCGRPMAFSDGTHTLVNGSTTFNSISTYACRMGFMVVGSVSRTCQGDGQWSGSEPTCQRVSCGQPAGPSNGRVDTSAGTSFGDVVMYTCDTGYTLSGVAERRCQADKRWNGSVPTCERVMCGQLDAPSNGVILPPNIDGAAYFGHTVTYSCERGYDLIGPVMRTCQADGQWNGSVPTCEMVSCGPLVAPSNGRVDTSDGTLFGDTATYSCDAGYPISGPSKRTCKANGQWSGTMPTCEIVDCGPPTFHPNGTVTLVSGTTTYNSMALYDCRAGFKLIGSNRGICQANGKWDGSEGRSCREKKTCSLPLDIMIVLDHSASVKEPSFDKQTTFTRGFVSLLPVAKDKIRVGLIRYWHIVELVFDFDDFFNDTALEIVIGAMRRPTWHQRTSTGAAIQRMVETFTGDNGARDPTVATHVGIVITDGKATDSIADPLKAARSKNITMFAYGIGKSAFSEGSDQLRELREIASDASTVEVVDIDELNNLVNRLIDRFVNCDDSSTTPPPAPTACQPTEYYNQTAGRCEACFCNGFERTTAPLQCDPITGSCICRDEGRRGGPRCDRCIWELRGENCDMCKEGMKIKNKQGPETCRR